LLLDLEDKLFLQRRIFRLRAYVYYKIPWMTSYDIMRRLIGEGDAVEIPGSWLVHPGAVERGTTIKDEYMESFARKNNVVDEWNKKSNAIGHHGETIIGDAFRDAGYVVTRNAMLEHSSGKLQVDVLCKKEGLLPLSVEVKNILSEVILDPVIVGKPSALYSQIKEEFEIGSSKGMIPVLVAPFVDRSFYVSCDRHRGLFCQTYLQLLPPGEEELRDKVKQELHFGNLRVVSKAPENVVRWIDGVAGVWKRRYGAVGVE
jgi:hypothetical protein